MTVELNHPVPDLHLSATSATELTLSQLQGQQVVLYFYPKDSTPGCTTEGQDFRDHHAQFRDANTVIFGISRDSLVSHEKFRCAQNFPFELISDPDEQLCRQFDVIQLKNLYGKQVEGIERSTFLLDRQGVLRQIWRKVKVDGHVAEVLAAAQALHTSTAG